MPCSAAVSDYSPAGGLPPSEHRHHKVTAIIFYLGHIQGRAGGRARSSLRVRKSVVAAFSFWCTASAALVWVEPAFAAHCPFGQLWRVRLGECVSLSSPLARPYIGTRKSPGAIPAMRLSKLETKTATAPALMSKVRQETDSGRPADPRPPVQTPAGPKAPDSPPDEFDRAAWLLMPLLQAVEARWADLIKPAPLMREDGQKPPTWPSKGVLGLEF